MRVFVSILALLLATSAHAQTPTNFSSGSAISSSAVNSAFASKQDYGGAGSFSTLTATGGTISGADVSGAKATATGGTTAQTLSSAVPLSLVSFGAKCDGATDDSAAVTAAVSSGKRGIIVPTGATCIASSVSASSIAGLFIGPGQIRTSDGNSRGPVVSTLTAAPAVKQNWSTDSTAWNGSLGGVGWAHEHVVTGAATLGQPTSGYQQTIEASGELEYTYNSSGWNNSLSGNGGRTGLAGRYMKVDNYGQGDLNALQCSGIVASTRSGATNYLASPEIACLAGGLYGGANGSYIEYLGDMNINDNGYDIAAAGTVMNYNRTVGTEALGTNWIGDARQSIGSIPIDAFYRASGPSVFGFDLSSATFASYRLSSVSVNSGGTGYTVGDLLTVTGGTSTTPTVLQVATIGASNAIASVTPVNTGIYSAPPVSTYTTLTTTGGTGSGANISGFYSNNMAFVMPQTGGCFGVAQSTSSSPISVLSGYGRSLCMTVAGMNYGPANTVPTAANYFNVVAGYSNNVQGNNNTVLGGYVYDVAALNSMFFSSGNFTGQGAGKSQTSWRLLRGSGTGAMRLTGDQNAAGGQNSYTVLASSVHNLSFRVSCIDATNSDAAVWKLRGGMLTRTAAGATAYAGDATAGTAPDLSTGAGSTASLVQSADTTNNALNTTVTPPTGTGHTWRCEEMVEGEQLQ